MNRFAWGVARKCGRTLVQKIGVISDTHGLLRTAVLDALRSVDVILHAGDVGAEDVLLQLQTLAPVLAVRGNVDTAAWAMRLPSTASLTLEQVRFYLIHDYAQLVRHPAPSGTRVVVYGHSHKPSQTDRDGVLYLNPGSVGRRRFSLPVSFAVGQVDGPDCQFSFRELTGEP